MINSRDSEPWSYGEEVEQIARNYIKFRYQLLPYLYSLFYEASVNGVPVQRSLAIEYPHDPKIYDHSFQHQYLFGPAIMVIPVESNKEFVRVYFPAGNSWYSLYNGGRYSGQTEMIVDCPLHRLPVFVVSGAIIPMQPAISHTGEKSSVLIIHLYAGESENQFVYYQDDGISFDYQKDVYAKRLLHYQPDENKFVIGASEGSFNSPVTTVKLVLHGFQRMDRILVNGEAADIQPEVNRFFAGLEKFDPIKDPEPGPEEDVQCISFPYMADAIVISDLAKQK